MPIPINVCFLWPGTNASIPAGWARETLVGASRFPKGAAAGVDPGATGGASTHSHTTATHVHTGNHTHTIQNSGAGTGTTSRDSGSTNPPATHTHDTNPSTGQPTTDLTTQAPASSVDSHLLSFLVFIIIKSDGTPTGVPDLAVAAWNDPAGPPASWNLCDGGGAPARPDMRNRYVQQAATGGDGGGTGGSLTHTHTITSHAHSLTFSHVHTDATSSQKTQANVGGSIGGAQAGAATSTHTHSLGTNDVASTVGFNTDTNTTVNHEPPFYTQAFIQNNAGANSWPDRIIGLWLGTLASIPTDWALCDGTLGTPDLRALFVKGANVIGDIGVTGGSLSHTHTATGHTHSLASHTHSINVGSGVGENRTAGATNCSTTAHTHSWLGDAAAGTSGLTAPTVNSFTDTQPSFTGVAFIQWQEPPAIAPLIAAGYAPAVIRPDLQDIHTFDDSAFWRRSPSDDDFVAVLFPPEVVAAIEELVAAGYSPELFFAFGESPEPEAGPQGDAYNLTFLLGAGGMKVGSLMLTGVGR